MPTLHLLRHAKSSWADAGESDRDRPLTSRGRRAAAALAEHLGSRGIAPGMVLCSSARRTRETLDLIAPSLPGHPPALVEDGLYGATADELLDRLREVPAEVSEVLLIGHNPGIEELAVTLAGGGGALVERMRGKFPTCALATLEVRATDWHRITLGGADLVAFVVPGDLD